MKILQVCPYDYRRPGGVQAHIRCLGRALRERGHEVTIVAPRSDRIPSDEEAQVRHFGRGRPFRFQGTGFEVVSLDAVEARALREHLVAARYDLVHLHTPWSPWLPAHVLRACATPAVATFHDVPRNTFVGRMARALMRLGARALLKRRLSGAIAVSAASAAHLPRSERVARIPNMVDLAFFRSGSHPPHPLTEGGPTVLFVGRLEERKGAATLVKAALALFSEGSDLRLLLAGAGPEEAALRRLVPSAWRERVLFLGEVSEGEKASLLRGATLFCAPSLGGESFGIVLVEAMASDTPVVAAANEGYRTVLEGEGRAGLVPPGDVAALAEKLRSLLASESRREALRTWQRGAVVAFDSPAVAVQVESFYRRSLEFALSRS